MFAAMRAGAPAGVAAAAARAPRRERPRAMRVVVVSDTHGRHGKLPPLPGGDVLIHAGDFTARGAAEEVAPFARWLASLEQYKHKLVCAGNHELCLDASYSGSGLAALRCERELKSGAARAAGVTYLKNAGITIDGVSFWASPMTPRFGPWAFAHEDAAQARAEWARIPEGTDVLITHGPPRGILDLCWNGARAGCEELRKRVDALRPAAMVFGHIHEAAGVHTQDDTLFVNASSVNLNYDVDVCTDSPRGVVVFDVVEAGRATLVRPSSL